MQIKNISAVMIHVPKLDEAIAWYEKAFSNAKRQRTEIQDFTYLLVGGVRLEIVQADEKVSSGPSGTIVYWEVEDVAQSLNYLQSLGAKLYRGPMNIEDKRCMCQVQDPWGNCIGLRGPLA